MWYTTHQRDSGTLCQQKNYSNIPWLHTLSHWTHYSHTHTNHPGWRSRFHLQSSNGSLHYVNYCSLTCTQCSIPYKSTVTLTGEAPVIVGTGCILITRITQTLVNVLTCMSITSVARGAGTLIAAWSVQTLCILITCPRIRTFIDIYVDKQRSCKFSTILPFLIPWR